MALKFYYSSGSLDDATFPKEARFSIGGYRTTVEVQEELNALFGTVSQMAMGEGSKQYKCIFVQNDGDDITGLGIYVDEAVLAGDVDPEVAFPAPEIGTRAIVPELAIGAWEGYDGKLATYNGTSWDFQIPPLSKYRFGVVDACDFVDVTEDAFTQPYGVPFVSADGLANIKAIGDGKLAKDAIIALWIEKSVAVAAINSDDLILDAGGIQQVDEDRIIFSYD